MAYIVRFWSAITATIWADPMSTSKYLDKICLGVILFAIALMVLFINGEALGIQTLTEEETKGQFTANDLKADWDISRATKITLNGEDGTVVGNGAYIVDGDVHIVYAGSYVISGELKDGSILVEADGDDKVWILLNGVSLHCEDNAAILVEQAEKVFLTLAEGTENVVSSGGTYTEKAVETGIDGTIYSRDDLTINGAGNLRVTAQYQHGIVCNDDLVFTGGQIDISAPEDGIHANDSVRITQANLNIAAKDDGITVSNEDATDYLYIHSGSVTVSGCYEGLEATSVTIEGGTVDLEPTDDGINAQELITISGGEIRIVNTTGRDADGLDSNRDIVISGGYVFISVSANGGSCALDYGSERGGICRIDGGTVVACGGSQMLEGLDEESRQAFVIRTVRGEAGAQLILRLSDGTEVLNETIPAEFNAVTLSVPEMKLGDVCSLIVGDVQEEITVDCSIPEGLGGMGGHGMSGGRQNADAENPPEGFEGPFKNHGQRPEMGEMPAGVEKPQIGDRPNRGESPEMGNHLGMSDEEKPFMQERQP